MVRPTGLEPVSTPGCLDRVACDVARYMSKRGHDWRARPGFAWNFPSPLDDLPSNPENKTRGPQVAHERKLMTRRIALVLVVLAALVQGAAAQNRLPPPVQDLPRQVQMPPQALPSPPEDNECDRREYTRLVRLLLTEPPQPDIFQCRPSTAWAVCQAYGQAYMGNALRMHGILSDLESVAKKCEKLGY